VATQSKHGFLTAIEQSHGRELRRFLSRRLPARSADVPDLVQEIFLRLLRIKDHEAIRNPQAYLFTVASHVLHQHALQRSTKPELANPLAVAMECQAAAVPDPADQLEMQESLERLGRELKDISPRAYAALVMYRCEGMTLTEIGKRLGVSHVMVRKYLSRAIEYCDRRLEEDEQGIQGHT
jgi:RNA polymerase sigma factor (sigma-70 family)